MRGKAMVRAGTVVACDAEALPFPDGTFEYAVCSHLIEHVNHPDRVLAELSRVAAAGYIECPNADYDKLDTPPYHKWFVTLEDGVLVLRQKDRAVFDPGIKDLMYETFYKDGGFWSSFWRHLDRFFVMLEWRDEIPYRVEYLDFPDGTPGSADNSILDDFEWAKKQGFTLGDQQVGFDRVISNRASNPLIDGLWKVLRLVARGKRSEIDWRTVVVCPVDHGHLDEKESSVVCRSCGAAYKVVENIPLLYGAVDGQGSS